MNDRIWDVENKRKQKTVIVVKSKERGTRTKITTCAYSPDGKHIGASQSWEPPCLFPRVNVVDPLHPLSFCSGD